MTTDQRPHKRVKLCTEPTPEPEPVRLFAPTALLRHVIGFVRDAATIANFALASKRTLAVVMQLPDTACLMLHDSEVFRGRPFPIGRALRVLLQRKCELCGAGNVKGAKPEPFGLFAHDKCIAAQLENAYYLSPQELVRLEAAHAPYVIKDGYNPQVSKGERYYSMQLFWVAKHQLLHPCETVDGARDLTLDEAKEAGQARLARAAASKALLEAAAPRIAQLQAFDKAVAAAAAARSAAVATARVFDRHAQLDEALVLAGMHPVAKFKAVYGCAAIEAEDCIGGYLRARIRAPYPQAEAVRRLQHVVGTAQTLADIAAARAKAAAAQLVRTRAVKNALAAAGLTSLDWKQCAVVESVERLDAAQPPTEAELADMVARVRAIAPVVKHRPRWGKKAAGNRCACGNTPSPACNKCGRCCPGCPRHARH